MSRFFGTAVNGHGNTKSFGGRRKNAGETHLRGWDAGVKVVPMANGQTDEFYVYMTYGSRAAGHDTLLGVVTATPDGPVFEPAEKQA